MLWRLAYQEDIKSLRSVLGSHVATINLLLMTQTLGSISAAEKDREKLACGLEEKVLAHRRLLEDVKNQVSSTLSVQLELKLQLQHHSASHEILEDKADRVWEQLEEQGVLIK